METKDRFLKWLINNSGRSKNTIDKYVRAITTMSKDISKITGRNVDIYNMTTDVEIDLIKDEYLSIYELSEKDKRGNRMYTSSFKWYKDFLSWEREEESHISTSYRSKVGQVFEREESYGLKYQRKAKGDHYIKESEKYWKRDRKVVENVLSAMGYNCEEDITHCHFSSKATGMNYVEGHHLIPMKYQDEFEYSLDVEANVVSLCVVCHKKLHLASMEEKSEIIKKLYETRKEKLKESSIDISLEDLINLYH